MVNIVPNKHQHVSILTLAFSSKPRCAEEQTCKATSLAADSSSPQSLAIQIFVVLALGGS